MPTLAEISNAPEGFRETSQVPRDGVRLVWHSDFWDGPRSGVLEFNGERCWFEVIAENEDEDLGGWYRRFAIVRLTPEQLAEECKWHDLFREKVGVHTDYDALGTRLLGELQPREQWREFYDAYEARRPLDFAENEVLGWFEH